jgi:predicted alpha/beta-fold hydrolase
MITASQFKPPWFLANPHLQTIWPFVFRSRRYPPYKMERLELPDGDFIDLLWTAPSVKQPIVVLLHGLEGSYQSHYMSGLLRSLHQGGFRCVVMHFRGCSGEPNRLERAYHSGETAFRRGRIGRWQCFAQVVGRNRS